MQYDYTEEWRQYQTGVDYNNKINLYNQTELYWNFYNGKQWNGIQTNGLSKWTFNICRSAINYMVASVCSQPIKMKYSAENIPDEPTDPQQASIKEFIDTMNDVIDMKWEKDKMDSKLRQLMLDGAVAKDFCAHVYWDASKETGQAEKGDYCTELVDGVNVLFGNPNNRIVEAQPYIIVVGREMVSKLREEAKANGIDKNMIESITSDNEYEYQAGQYGKIELDSTNDNGKCLYLIKYYKKGNKVYWNKSTKYCPIRKDVELGINRYPVAWGNWESIKNSYHGMASIEGIIDNQIQINVLFAIVSHWMKLNAFGKPLYDKTRIDGWSNAVGTAIGVNGPVDGVFTQLQAGNFNAAILEVINLAIKYTKDFVGSNDAALGQINPEQASGIAILSTAKQASIPLENPMANRDQFVEDLGLIWGEFQLKKYGNRKVTIKKDNKVQLEDFSNEGMEDVLLQCKVDVGPSTYWSEITSIQTLDNLLEKQAITALEYFERVPKGMIPKVQELIDTRKEMLQQQANQEAEYEAMAQFIEQLPPEVQAQLEQLRNTNPMEYENQVRNMMNQQQMMMQGGVM